jgi:anti-anti-sigma factor
VKTNASKRKTQDGTLTLTVIDEDSTRTVALAGELDLANAETLASELERAESASDGMLTIDLSELEFIDSTGIAILVATYRRLEGGERLCLVPSKARAVRRVMSLTGLDTELPFHSSPS